MSRLSIIILCCSIYTIITLWWYYMLVSAQSPLQKSMLRLFAVCWLLELVAALGYVAWLALV